MHKCEKCLLVFEVVYVLFQYLTCRECYKKITNMEPNEGDIFLFEISGSVPKKVSTKYYLQTLQEH
jgi:hypothetical protein